MALRLFVLAIALISISAHAEYAFNALNYEKFTQEEKQEFALYLFGVGEGAAATQSHYKSNGGFPLYCRPSGLALAGVNYLNIFEEELKKNMYRYKMSAVALGNEKFVPSNIVLLRGLISTFPCRKN